METGKVVEFIDSQKIVCAVVLENKNQRLRLLTENNREVKLGQNRLSHSGTHLLAITAKREKLVAQLKEVAAQRRSLSERIDVRALWEILHEEQTWIDLPTMAGLCFAEKITDHHESAVLRAFFSDRLYFKFSAEGFWPQPADKVEELMKRRAAEERLQRLVDQAALWMQKVLKGQTVAAPAEGAAIAEILAAYYLFDKESPQRDTARLILKKAGGTSAEMIFKFLAGAGIWREDENLDLLRHNIVVEQSAAVQAAAQAVVGLGVEGEGRRDLRHLSTLTIDGPETLDFDDALSIEGQDDLFTVGIHITDVAHYISPHELLDIDARDRVSTIYMPDRKIPMLPLHLSEDVCSLKVGVDRPALSTLVHMTARAEIIDFEIVPSLVNVRRQLTYPQADELLDHDAELGRLLAIARRYRERRMDQGAMIIELPEIAVKIGPQGEPLVCRLDRETPARFLMAELMILANELAARRLTACGLPAIFRSQAEPRERLYQRDQGSLFQNWMQRKHISRFMLGSQPETHSGLGLPAYVTSTSPLRKYTDLVTQRQLRAALGLGAQYDREAIEALIRSIEEPLGMVARIQHRRHHYWVLKHLEQRIGTKQQAIYLGRQRRGPTVLLPAYMLECSLSGADNIALKPAEEFTVTIQHAHARNEALTVCWG